MDTTQITQHYGGKAEAIAALEPLGVYRQLFDKWEKAGKIPSWRQTAIEAFTKGKLKADRPAKVST